MDAAQIRNFCIIAHIDHGKTTLSDRLLEATGAIAQREMREQLLDSMDLERERGITIKAHPVTMSYVAPDGRTYELNLIDTPGHVDFAYEVSRSLAACEGALLVVDAGQGVEAQTVANVHLAAKQNLAIIPVINKIDLPNANVDETRRQIEELLAIPADTAVLASAKTGLGIEDILRAVIERIPPPQITARQNDQAAARRSGGAGAPPGGGKAEATERVGDGAGDGPLRALVFDSVFDTYRGVVSYVRLFEGQVVPGQHVRLMAGDLNCEVKEVGVFTPKPAVRPRLAAGDVGYVIANIKSTVDVKIGDTMTDAQRPAPTPLPGFQQVHPMVFSGLYPIDSAEYERLKAALAKLQLNDAAFLYQQESSAALGFGFRCGFLGLLHMEIVQERLRRQFDMDIIATYPSVIYRVLKTNSEVLEVDNPVFLPDPTVIEQVEEPYVRAFIICPNQNIGDLLSLIMDKRGLVTKTDSIDTRRVMLTAEMPLNEIVVDFHDKIKSVTRGYGSMDYEPLGYRPGDLIKLDILVNGEPVDAFSSIVHRAKAESRGRVLCEKLSEVIPRQLFLVAIQAAIGGKIIARESVRALAKNVTAKCYGGDITRKRKLWEKQKEGKKRMKQVGTVNIPQEAFIQVLKTG